MAKKRKKRSQKTEQNSTKNPKEAKPKSSWQRKIIAFFTAVFGAGIIAFFTPIFGVLDNASGGFLSQMWGTVATIEDNITTTLKDSNDIPSPRIQDFQEDQGIGLPAFESGDPMVVAHQFYTLRYNETHEQAEWVAYTLQAKHLKGNHPRGDHFKVDPAVPTETAKPTDYAKSGYDRGHLAPAADFSYSAKAIDESFYMSNMSPQLPAFNRGMWKGLENKVRDWAIKKKELYIVSGPILKTHLRKIGQENRISIPKQFYKIVVNLDPKHPHAIAFLMPNEMCEGFYDDYRVSIDAIEALTQIDFFHKLPDDLEAYLEKSNTSDRWFDAPEAVPSPN